MKGLFYTLLCALLVVSVNSCKKDKTTTQNQPPAGSIQLWSNVHVVDSTQWILHSSTNGNYYYYFTPTTPNINVKVGDILVGATNGGYIVKVLSATVSGGYYLIRTTKATMADVFKSGTFSFQIPLNDPSQSGVGFSRSFTNYSISNQAGFNLSLVKAQFSIAPSLNCSFLFDSSGLRDFQMATTNTSAKDSLSIEALGKASYGWSKDTTLAKFDVNSIIWVQTFDHINVPVVVQLNYSLHVYSAGIPSLDTVDTRAAWLSHYAFTGGLKYTGGSWQGIHTSVATNTVSFDTASKLKFTSINFSFKSFITSKFYTISGPTITTGVTGSLTQHFISARAFDRGTSESNINIIDQSSGAVFGRGLPGFTQTWGSDTIVFQTPGLISKISGDGQTAHIITTLPNPIVVRVTDTFGNPVTNAVVTFSVPSLSGYGSFNGSGSTSYDVPSDANGLAQVNFKLGPHQGNDTISATVINGQNHPINGAPVKFIEIGN